MTTATKKTNKKLKSGRKIHDRLAKISMGYDVSLLLHIHRYTAYINAKLNNVLKHWKEFHILSNIIFLLF